MTIMQDMSLPTVLPCMMYSVRRGLGRAALACFLLLAFVSGAGAQSASTVDVGRIPPIDLFVYADQSGSAYKSINGIRPADQLADMIRQAIDSKLAPGDSRTVLSGSGRFYLYGFGENNPAGELANDCSDDVQVLASGLGAGERGQIDEALSEYASQDPGNQATNFICLMESIAANQDIVAAGDRGRQAIVLIASDFLHDQFNMAEIKEVETGDRRALLANGNILAGKGICDLQKVYAQGILPEDLATELQNVAKIGQETTYPPLYATLYLKLTAENFSNPNGDYAGCAIETANSGQFVTMFESAIRAEHFRFEDAALFGQQFIEKMISRIAPSLRIASADIKPISNNVFEIRGEIENPSAFPARVQGLSVSALGQQADVASFPGGELRVAANSSLPFGPILATFLAPVSVASLDVSLEYNSPNNDALQVTKASPWPVNSEMDLELSVEKAVQPPGAPAKFPLTLTNNGSDTWIITSVMIGENSPGTNAGRESGGLNVVQAGGVPVRQEVLVPNTLLGALKDGRLKVFVTVRSSRLPASSGSNTLEASVPPPGPVNKPEVVTAVMHFRNSQDNEPKLEVSIRNKNDFDLHLEALVFEDENGESVGKLTIPSNRSIVEANAASYLMSFDDMFLKEIGIYREIIRHLREARDLRVYAVDERIPDDEQDSWAKVVPRFDDPQRVVCPSEGDPTSYEWTLPANTSGRLILRVRDNLGAEILPPIEGYRVSNGITTRMQPEGWRSDGWTRRGAGNQQADVAISFDDPDMRDLRYESRGNLTIDLLTGMEEPICSGPISVPAFEAGDPEIFRVDDDSWKLVGSDTGDDQLLEFLVYHNSRTSLQRLEEVRVLHSNEAGRGANVNFEFVNEDSSGSAYFYPGIRSGRKVRINLTQMGYSEQDLGDLRLRLFSYHDLAQETDPAPISVRLKAPVVLISNQEWRDDEAVLSLNVRIEGPYSVKRMFIFGKNTPDRPVRVEGDKLELHFNEQPIQLRSGREQQVTASLPEAMQLQELPSRILSQDYLYACVPIANSADCSGWERLPPLPRTRLMVSVREAPRQTGGIGYDALDRVMRFSLRNSGPYLDVINGVRFYTTRGGEIEERLPSPFSLRPGEARSVEMNLSELVQQFLLEAVEFQFSVQTRQGSGDTRFDGIADPPQISVEKFEVSQLDYVVQSLYNVIGSISGFDSKKYQPVATGQVTVERVAGQLNGYDLRLGLSKSEGNFISDKNQTVPVQQEGGTQRSFSTNFAIGLTDEDLSALSYVQAILRYSTSDKVADKKRVEVRGDDDPTWMAKIMYFAIALSLVVFFGGIFAFKKVRHYRSFLIAFVVSATPVLGSLLGMAYKLHPGANPAFSGIVDVMINSAAVFFSFFFVMVAPFFKKMTRILSSLGFDIDQYRLYPYQSFDRIMYNRVRFAGILLLFLSIGIAVFNSGEFLRTPDVCSPSYDIKISSGEACQ